MEPVTSQAKSRKTGERFFRTTKTCNIPHLTDLRKQLGYGNAGEEQDIAFKRAVREQVGNFVSSGNIQAYRFTKWKTTAHQKGLVEITRNFLDTKGKGPEFWPDIDSSTNKRPLQYSKDSAQIRRLMIKVFWRAARECKRSAPKNPTNPPSLSQSNDTSDPPVKSEDNSGDTNGLFPDSVQDPRGRSVHDPIDLEDMQSDTSVTEMPVDSFDPFANYTIFTPSCDSPDGRYTSPNPLFAPVASDIIGFGSSGQASDNATENQPARGESPHGTDPYDFPDSPRAMQNAQDHGKRPADPNPNHDHRAKVPRQELSNSDRTTNQTTRDVIRKGTKTHPEPTRTSSRAKKQTVFFGCDTQEEREAVDVSSSSSLSSSLPPRSRPPEYRSYENQGQQAKDKANGSTSIASSSSDSNSKSSSTDRQGQPPTKGKARAGEAARAAARQAAEAAGAAAEKSTSVPAGLATTQGSMPSMSSNQTRLSQTGPSRQPEFMQESVVRRETGSAISQDLELSDESQEGRIHVTDEEQNAWDKSTITFRSNISNGPEHAVWMPSSDFLQMSLQSVTDELGLKNYGTLHISFRSREDRLPCQIEQGDEDGFKSFKEECLTEVSQEYQIAALTPEPARRKLRYFIRFSIHGRNE
ncbi:hypothetical protein FSARC_1363 [Fusarium sarcochroum]|uniref:Uncharacterized protein n=1 Tax=Fusarium sarcochroum TaxID=1208366 RepID=A0A8H4U9N7_9HYPO|nr:hypothetical protein FSARC_1363 [Fusarium sarcochroum]